MNTEILNNEKLLDDQLQEVSFKIGGQDNLYIPTDTPNPDISQEVFVYKGKVYVSNEDKNNLLFMIKYSLNMNYSRFFKLLLLALILSIGFCVIITQDGLSGQNFNGSSGIIFPIVIGVIDIIGFGIGFIAKQNNNFMMCKIFLIFLLINLVIQLCVVGQPSSFSEYMNSLETIAVVASLIVNLLTVMAAYDICQDLEVRDYLDPNSDANA